MVLPAPSRDEALSYLRGEDVDDAESLLAFHSGAPLFAHAPEMDDLREELLTLLAAPRLLTILDLRRCVRQTQTAVGSLH